VGTAWVCLSVAISGCRCNPLVHFYGVPSGQVDARTLARFSFLIRIHWYNLLNHQDFRVTVGPYQREAALYVQVNNFRMRRYPGVGFAGLSEMDSFRTHRKNRPKRDRQRSSKFQWRESASQARALKSHLQKQGETTTAQYMQGVKPWSSLAFVSPRFSHLGIARNAWVLPFIVP